MDYIGIILHYIGVIVGLKGVNIGDYRDYIGTI